jgi:iron complex outermembrane receptor protein
MKTDRPCLRVTLPFAALAFAHAFAGILFAQAPGSGVIEGRVFEAATGSALRNARVILDGNRAEALTDENGGFRLNNVPVGEASLRASYGIMNQQVVRVTVTAGQTQRQDFNLTSSDEGAGGRKENVIRMTEFTVEGRELSAQAAAIEEQRAAPNIKNVVSFQEFADLGEGNPGEFLKYIPGVQIEQSPAVPSVATLRGMPANGTLVTVDGVQIAGILAANRDFAFSGSDAASIDRVEVSKVPTPDMPANAVGGSINMVSRSGFNNRNPVFNYHIYGTLSTLDPKDFFSLLTKKVGADSKTDVLATQPGVDLAYSRPLGKSLAISASYTYNDRFEDEDYFFQTWDRVRGVATATGLQASSRIRPRTIISGKIDWKPGENHLVSLNVQNLKEDFINDGSRLDFAYGAGVVGDGLFSQGAGTGVGTATQNFTFRAQHRFSNHAILKYKFDDRRWIIDASLQRSGGGENTRNIEDGLLQNASLNITNLILRSDGLDGINSRRAPRTTATSRTGQTVDVYNGNLYTLNTVASLVQPNRQDAESAALNVSRVFDTKIPLTLKMGAAIDRVERRVRSQTRSYTFNPPASVGRTVGELGLLNNEYSGDGPHFQDEVTVRWADIASITKLFQQNPTWFTLNEAAAHTSRVQGSKDLTETISAGYVRTDARFFERKLWVVAGVRFERTDDEGRGPLTDPAAIYRRDAAGNFLRGPAGELLPITTDALERTRLQNKELSSYKKAHYRDFYPSINTSYSLTDDVVFRAAYARTIGRPNLTFVLPGVSVTDIAANTTDRRITVINSGLDPWEADNYDLSFEAYNLKGGTASLSLFRKDITGFFSTIRTPATPADLTAYGLSSDYLGYDVVTSENSNDDIKVTGLEFSWRQSLKPLGVPVWAHPLQVFFNTSYKRLGGAGKDNFTDFTPKLVSFGVTYASKRILAKVNVNQTAPLRNGLLATNATTPAGSYNSQGYRCLVDASFEYMFHKRFSIYGGARNLAQFARRVQVVSPNAPEYARPTQYNYYGVFWTFGVKGTF